MLEHQNYHKYKCRIVKFKKIVILKHKINLVIVGPEEPLANE